MSLVLGYTIASEVRGLTYNPVFWSVVSVTTSPVYWSLCLVAGAVLVGATNLRLGTPAAAARVVASAVATTGVLTLGYAILNAVY